MKIHQTRRKKLFKTILIGIFTGIAAILIFGIPTALIKTPFFGRMIPATSADYTFLVINSILIGWYVALHVAEKNERLNKGDALVAGGTFTNILAIACAICIAPLVALFGATALLTYFAPYQPLLGLFSTIILAGAVYWKFESVQKKKSSHY